MTVESKREIWIDNVKVIACVLVLLGHFFQSMTKSNVLSANDLYCWFNQTIYYFHVPLFFICSGYLYQKLSCVENFYSWRTNTLKKALNLGVPYFTFSFATWLLKTVFSSSTNDEIGGLFDTLFLHPTSPYWYLYALFLIFVITPTFKEKRIAAFGLVVSLAFKVLNLIVGGHLIPALSYIFANEVWFVVGMCMSVIKFQKYIKRASLQIPIFLGAVFIFLSIVVYKFNLVNGLISFLLGILACCSIVMIIWMIYEYRNQSKLFEILANYTMPIFLMHTLFAAPLRTILLKIGVHNAMMHVFLGIAISFIGPIIATKIIEKLKWPEFFLYPGKFIKIK